MKTKLKFILVGAFAIGGVVAAVNSESAGAATLTPVSESVSVTRTLYRQHCAICHGNDGRSNTKRGRETEANDLTTDDVKGDSIEKISRIISNGKGDMPGFKRKLSSTQIASIARYVKTL